MIRKNVKFLFNNNLLIIIIAVLIVIIASILLIDNNAKSKESIRERIQIEANNTFKNLKSEGDKYIYYNNQLVSWTNNEIPISQTYKQSFEADFIKLHNGYYFLAREKNNDTIILHVSLFKNEYTLNNNYLNNKFNHKYSLDKEENINITFSKTDYPIQLGKSVVCYLDFSQYEISSNRLLAYVFSLLYFLFIFFFLQIITNLIRRLKLSSYIIILLMAVTYLAIFLILHYIDLPSLLSNFYLFSHFITMIMLLSIGEIFVIQIFIIVFLLNAKMFISSERIKIILTPLLILFSWLYFYFIEFSLTHNPTSITLTNVLKLDVSTFVVLIQLMMGGYIFFLLVDKIIVKPQQTKFKILYVITILLIAVFSISFLINKLSFFSLFIISFFLFVMLISILNQKGSIRKIPSTIYIIILLISFSSINGLFVYEHNIRNDKLFVEKALKQLSENKDYKTERQLIDIEKNIVKDSNIIKPNKIIVDLEQYIIDKYFSEIAKTYSVEVLICNENESLFIPPLNKHINCKQYINSRLQNTNKLLGSKALYKDNSQLDLCSYLGYFEISKARKTQIIFIDCFEKKTSKEMGYPDLLIDKEVNEGWNKINLDHYAVYQNNSLVIQVGTYNYSSINKFKASNKWQRDNDFLHYILKNNKNNTLWITSLKEPTISDKLSLTSFLFLFSSIALVLFMIIINPKKYLSIKMLNINNSLQIAIVFIFIISFIVFGGLSTKSFEKLNQNNNKEIQIEKTQSIAYDLENYFSNNQYSHSEVYDKLVKLSNTLLTDINLYDKKGFLYNTSRPTIFSQGIISKLMNNEAIAQLNTNPTQLIFLEEKIGNRTYNASYVSIPTDNGKEFLYIHIPYIIQQKSLDDKLLDFISTFINVYIVWITLALILSVILSNFITRPLRQMQDKLISIRLNQRNEKIKWKRKDELGGLILAYNSMVDKMEESAKLLLKQEREGAWKEMAKQVAHDIKNPLTPMKLSIQQLQRLQSIDIVKFHERFKELSPSLIEQINTLADIASEFSDYAKDKINLNETSNIDECLKAAIDVFENKENIRIIYTKNFEEKAMVYGDKQQYVRIFNNLIKNSIQSLALKEDGLIEIDLSKNETEFHISIKDNGCGISEENQKKIFSNKFTTKIEGSGLGLSIVKSIIETIGGKITFESIENIGTQFNIYLPIKKQ